MIYGAYLVGLVIYALSVCLSYSTMAKASNWYFPIGIGMAIIANFMWLWIAKNSPAHNDIYIRGLVWDSMIVGCYALIPFLFGVKLNGTTALGVSLVIAGLILTKIGG